MWSRETGSAVPSRVSLLLLHTQAESGAYSRDFSRFPRRRSFIYLGPPYAIGSVPSLSGHATAYRWRSNRHTPSRQSRVYRVTQLRTDGGHCRESAGTGPVNLKVVPNECCLCRYHHGPINTCLSLPNTHSNL